MRAQINFKELVDVEELQKLTDDLYAATAIPSAIISMDGEILTGSGWQRICTDFHRKHPDTNADCIASDIAIREEINKGENYVIYKCPRGLVDASSPVVIEGEHVANVFAGQLFTEKPGEKVEKAFREAARMYGFDENAYIDAYREIPILAEDNFKPILKFLSGLAKLVASIGLARMKENLATEEIHDANRKYLRLLQSTKTVPWELDLDTGEFTYMGPQSEALFGYPLSYWKDMEAWSQSIHPEDREWAWTFCSEETKKGKDHEFTYRMLTKDGLCLWIQDIVSVVMDETGPKRLVGFMHDVTESMRAKEKNQHFQVLMKYIIEHTRSAIAVHDRDLNYRYVSQRYLDEYNVKENDVIGKHHYEVFPDLPQKWRDVHQRALAGEVLSAEEDSYPKDDGSVAWTRWECRPWYESNGSIGGIIVYTEVITDRILGKKALLDSEEKYRNLFDQAGHGIAVADAETGIIFSCNRKLSEMLGYSPEEIIGKHQHFLQPGVFSDNDFSETFKAHREENAGLLLEGQLLAKDGSLIDVEILASPLSSGGHDLIQGFFYDISLRKKLIEDYRRAAQLAALGTVAAGVAHEINNPIQGIMNYATLIEKAPEKTDRVIDISQRIFKEGARIAKITQDLLHYSKNNVVEKVLADISILTQSALSLIDLKIKRQGIQIDVTCSVDLPMIPVQPQSFQQVIVNLVDNANDALQAKEMPLKDKVLSVGTFLQETEQNSYVCIEVYDNGIGMSESVQARAKEAFFSTKPSVQGTGLGLSIVNDILHKHNGKLIIESVEGEYCKMKALFPVA